MYLIKPRSWDCTTSTKPRTVWVHVSLSMPGSAALIWHYLLSLNRRPGLQGQRSGTPRKIEIGIWTKIHIFATAIELQYYQTCSQIRNLAMIYISSRPVLEPVTINFHTWWLFDTICVAILEERTCNSTPRDSSVIVAATPRICQHSRRRKYWKTWTCYRRMGQRPLRATGYSIVG